MTLVHHIFHEIHKQYFTRSLIQALIIVVNCIAVVTGDKTADAVASWAAKQQLPPAVETALGLSCGYVYDEYGDEN